MNNDNRWIYSGRTPKVLGVISWKTLACFFMIAISYLFIWPMGLFLLIDILEAKFKMSSFEVFRSLIIKVGLLFNPKKCRELGPDSRLRLMTYFYGESNFDFLIFGFIRPLTMLLIYIAFFSYIGALFANSLDHKLFLTLTGLLRIVFFFSTFIGIIMLIFDIIKFFKNR